MRRLEQLALISRQVRVGRGSGERRSARRGSSLEFADYRDYTPGDDLRRLDWKVFARLGRPFIKLFEEEEDQTVHLVLDGSASMNWPEGDVEHNKWVFARRLVAALGYIALAGGDRLIVTHLNDDGHHSWGPYRGKGHIHSLLRHLGDLRAAGRTNLSKSLTSLAQQRSRPGLLFLLSDLFSHDGYEQGLSRLGSSGHELSLLHLLSPDEVEPELNGDLRLHDVETDLAQEVTIDPALRQRYRQQLDAWRTSIERYCFQRNINYATVSTDIAFDHLILGILRQRGFVQ